MRAKLVCKKRTILKRQYFILGIILIILFLFFSILNYFNNKVTPKLLSIASTGINRFNETILTNYTVKNLYNEIATLDNVIKITQNSKEEIISVDFNLESVYKALSIITNYLKENVENEKTRKKALENYNEWLSSLVDGIVLSLPIGIVNDSVFTANLGPKVPVKISYVGYVGSSIRIKLEDYGINNVLVSVYIDCSITNEIIIPTLKDKINHQYSILVASKIIQGTVPKYYGGSIETKSNVLNIPIE